MITDAHAANSCAVQRRPRGPALGALAASLFVHGGAALLLLGVAAGLHAAATADNGSRRAAVQPVFMPDLDTLDGLDLPPGVGGDSMPAAYRQPDAGLALALLPMPPETFVEAVQAWRGGFAVGRPAHRVAQALDVAGVIAGSTIHLHAYFTIEVRQTALRSRYEVAPADRLYALFPDALYAAVWQAVREAATARNLPAGAVITRAAVGFTPPRFAPVVPGASLAFEAPATVDRG